LHVPEAYVFLEILELVEIRFLLQDFFFHEDIEWCLESGLHRVFDFVED